MSRKPYWLLALQGFAVGAGWAMVSMYVLAFMAGVGQPLQIVGLLAALNLVWIGYNL